MLKVKLASSLPCVAVCALLLSHRWVLKAAQQVVGKGYSYRENLLCKLELFKFKPLQFS